ncbi:MAG TPA: hypothetical protein VFM93_08255 [Candidatus Limnocylindria bacterium]|nr:hypothetical protein [Candidatus Limnocylindria bacterium]
MSQLAAILVWFDAIGLAIPGLIGVRSLLAGHGVPLVLGYPSYGGGAFERAGIATSVPLLLLFLLVLIAEVPAGWLLWQGQRSGAVLALILLVPEAIFWWGFDLPIPPILGVARVIAIALAWEACGRSDRARATGQRVAGGSSCQSASLRPSASTSNVPYRTAPAAS